MMACAMDVLDPAGDTAIDAKVLARRPAALTGATIGILDNSKPNARVLLERVAQGLRERSPARPWVARIAPTAAVTRGCRREAGARNPVAAVSS